MRFHRITPAQNLLHMVMPVNTMKQAPVIRSQRTEDGVIEQPLGSTELLRSLGNDGIHFRETAEELFPHFFRGKPSWNGLFRSASALGQIFASQNQKRSRAVLQVRIPRQRRTLRQTALESFRRARIGQIKMLKNLRRTPFALRLPGVALRRKPCRGRDNVFLESFKVEIHGPLQAFI